MLSIQLCVLVFARFHKTYPPPCNGLSPTRRDKGEEARGSRGSPRRATLTGQDGGFFPTRNGNFTKRYWEFHQEVLGIYWPCTILVGGWATPLKNMTSSIGMIIPNIWGKKKGNQTTNQYVWNRIINQCLNIIMIKWTVITNQSLDQYGGFPKWGVPKNWCFIMQIPWMDVWGTHILGNLHMGMDQMSKLVRYP